MNAAGLAILNQFERCRLVSYWDVNAYRCGWGTGGADVDFHTQWTQAEADARRDTFILTVEAAIGRVVHSPIPLTDNQRSSLACFGYNVWPGEWVGGHTLAALNCGDYAAFAPLLLSWNHIKGVVNAELSRRRQAELDLFNTP